MALAGCGSSASAYDSTLRLPLYRGEMHDRGILDPAREQIGTPPSYVSLTQVGLVKLDPDLHVLPELAVSLPTISSNGRSYTFTIRQDARFADGKHCTASDVAYSLARALRFGSPLARRYLDNIEGSASVEAGNTWHLAGVKVLHRLTLRIRLNQPDESFLTKLAFPVAAVVEPVHTPGPPPGLGPFDLASVERDGTMILHPRTRYYGAPPQIREVRLVPSDTQTRGLSLYHSNALDAASVPFASFQALSARTDFASSPSLDGYYIVPRRPVPALALSINRDKLAAVVGPTADSLSSLVPPAVPDYQNALPLVTPDTAPRAPAVRLTGEESDPGIRAVRAALLKQWHESRDGIPVSLEHVWFLLPDPAHWLSLSPDMNHSTWYRGVVGRGGSLTNDPVGRMNLYATAENWSIARGSIVPLLSGEVGYLVRPTVDGLEVTPEGLMPANGDWTQVDLSQSR